MAYSEQKIRDHLHCDLRWFSNSLCWDSYMNSRQSDTDWNGIWIWNQFMNFDLDPAYKWEEEGWMRSLSMHASINCGWVGV